MTIERIVRPFQTPENSPGRTIIDTGFSQANAPVRLQLGRNGTPKTYQASFNFNATMYVVHQSKEKQASPSPGGPSPGGP